MSEELKITKERVLEAATKYTEARTVLKILFPEAFIKPPEEILYPDDINGVVFYADAKPRLAVTKNSPTTQTYSIIGFDLEPYYTLDCTIKLKIVEYLRSFNYIPIGRISLENKYLAPL